MRSRPPLYLLGVALLLAALAFVAWRAHRTLTSNLPPRIECRAEAEARALAGPGALAVLGTGSMAPFIPPAPIGQDPGKTIVAYAVTELATYADIQAGDLCLYTAEWTPGLVMHQAAQRDSLGWIMSGLGNAHSEARWRVTPANFRGIVARVYVWPLSP